MADRSMSVVARKLATHSFRDMMLLLLLAAKSKMLTARNGIA